MRKEFAKEKIALSVKEDKADFIKECYPCFGWTLTEEWADRNFFDIRHLAFERDCDIPHKDRLQYLQVRMEMRFNRLQTYQRKKFAASSSLFLALAVSGILLLAGGIYLLAFASSIGWGILLCVCSVFAFSGMAIGGFYLVRRENRIYAEQVSVAKREIIEFCREGERLTGGKDVAKEI